MIQLYIKPEQGNHPAKHLQWKFISFSGIQRTIERSVCCPQIPSNIPIKLLKSVICKEQDNQLYQFHNRPDHFWSGLKTIYVSIYLPLIHIKTFNTLLYNFLFEKYKNYINLTGMYSYVWLCLWDVYQCFEHL